jgi:hypothetical protein
MQRPPSNKGPRGLVDIAEAVDLPRDLAKVRRVGFAEWLFGCLGQSDLGDCLGCWERRSICWG